MKALCKVNYDYEDELTEGKIYDVIREEEGIFLSRPFLVVMGDHGKETAAHKSRFEIVEESSND